MAKYQIDTALAKDQLAALQGIHASWGIKKFLAAFIWILVKSAVTVGNQVQTTRLVPLHVNLIQSHLEDNLAQNNIIGKGRQQGFTTYLAIRRLFVPAILEGGIGSVLVAQTGADASEFFRIIRRAHQYIGAVDPFDAEQNTLSTALRQNLLHTAYSNKKELVFDFLDSKVKVLSAEIEEAGQGVTLHHILADEYARWPGNPSATLANIRGALVTDIGTVDKSSTANGMAGPYFRDFIEAMDAPDKSDSKYHFYPHYWSIEYQDKLDRARMLELEADLTSDELRLIAKMHKELKGIAFVKAA